MRDLVIVVLSVIGGMVIYAADRWWMCIVVGLCLGGFIAVIDDILELNRDDS